MGVAEKGFPGQREAISNGASPETSNSPGRIITGEFLALNAILFISFFNVAAFFDFHGYLTSLPIDAEWHGFLIALFSLVVLAVRPLISPFFTPGNARLWLAVSCAALLPIMLFYGHATDLGGMVLVRIVHGAAYVIMATAVTSRIVAAIPEGRSAQAFGLISVITLLPYAVVPPLMGVLTAWAGGFPEVLRLSSLLFAAVFPLLAAIKPHPAHSAGASFSLSASEVRDNFKDPSIMLVMVISLLVWTAFSAVFYFLKDYGSAVGIGNAGWFFTLSTATEIGVRLFAGSRFDRMDKRKLLSYSMLWLALGFPALVYIRGDIAFYALGIYMGLGWGVGFPVLSGLVFDISAPRLKALNTNMSLVMFQGGFFLGPLAGGAILSGWGHAPLYMACAAVQAACAAGALMIRKKPLDASLPG